MTLEGRTVTLEQERTILQYEMETMINVRGKLGYWRPCLAANITANINLLIPLLSRTLSSAEFSAGLYQTDAFLTNQCSLLH